MAIDLTGKRIERPTAPGMLRQITNMFLDPTLFIQMNTLPKNTAEGEPRTDVERALFGSAGIGSGLASNYLDNLRGTRYRRDLYHEYRSIEECFPEVCAGLDMYADYTVSGGATEKADAFEVTTEGGQYKEELDIIEDRIHLKDHIWSIARGTCRDGDDFYELIADGSGLSKIRALPKEEMFRKENDIGNLPLSDAFLQVRKNKKISFEQWQIAHFRIRVNNDDKYGRSVMWGARRVARDLMLCEDALSIARLSRSHQRLKYIIDIGEADAAEAKSIIEDFRMVNRRARTMSSSTGRMNMRNNPLTVESDVYVPRMAGGGADVGVIQGDKSYQHIPDILHKYDRLFACMKISKAWFGLTGPNIRSVVGEQGLNFMRTVRRIRNDLRVGMTHIYMVGLRLQGVPIEKLLDAELKFVWPMMSHADDELRFKLESIKLAVAKQYKDLGLMSRFDVMTRILRTDETLANDLLSKYDEERKLNPEMFGVGGSAVPAAAPPGGENPQSVPSPTNKNIKQEALELAVQKAIREDPTLSHTIANTMELVELLRDSLIAS